MLVLVHKQGPWVLQFTGASIGIGEALAHRMAARRRGRLEQLRMDLSSRHALEEAGS